MCAAQEGDVTISAAARMSVKERRVPTRNNVTKNVYIISVRITYIGEHPVEAWYVRHVYSGHSTFSTLLFSAIVISISCCRKPASAAQQLLGRRLIPKRLQSM
jgi:hypothetical protein